MEVAAVARGSAKKTDRASNHRQTRNHHTHPCTKTDPPLTDQRPSHQPTNQPNLNAILLVHNSSITTTAAVGSKFVRFLFYLMQNLTRERRVYPQRPSGQKAVITGVFPSPPWHVCLHFIAHLEFLGISTFQHFLCSSSAFLRVPSPLAGDAEV